MVFGCIQRVLARGMGKNDDDNNDDDDVDDVQNN